MMRGAIRVTLIRHDGEYQVPIFNMDQPLPGDEERVEQARKDREQKLAELRERMGAKWIGHPDYVKPTLVASNGKLL